MTNCTISQDKENPEPLLSVKSTIRYLLGNNDKIKISSADHELPIVSFSKGLCSKGVEDKENQIAFKILTNQGKKKGIIEIGSKGLAKFLIDESKLGVLSQAQTTLLRKVTKEICKIKHHVITYNSGKKLVLGVRDIVDTITPGCKFITHLNFYSCIPQTTDVKKLKKELAQINKEVLNKLERPPYILMRKLSMTRQFANKINTKSGLEEICKLSALSMQEETPLVFQTLEWKNGLCKKIHHQITKIQKYEALRLAYREILVLKTLAIENSSGGIVSLNISKTITGANKTFRVKFNPRTDVYETLKNSRLVATLPVKRQICWHPFGSDGSAEGRALFALGALRGPDSLCAHTSEDLEYGIKQVANSISGETSFRVSNFMGKIVRLPKGTYSYQVFTLSTSSEHSFRKADKVIKHGELVWSGKKYKTIR